MSQLRKLSSLRSQIRWVLSHLQAAADHASLRGQPEGRSNQSSSIVGQFSPLSCRLPPLKWVAIALFLPFGCTIV
jgi:hypothetical protein